jgi:hypothetical protein
MGKRPGRRRITCPHCQKPLDKNSVLQCQQCGRICTCTRWCCGAKGKPLKKLTARVLFSQNCPVCHPEKWIYPLLN